MKYREFGNSGLRTSVIGFGGWPMGKGHYGSFDEDEVVYAIHNSIHLGVTLFDTAAVYGWGEGEKLLGRALEGKRDKVVLVSKGGLDWNSPGSSSKRNSSREHLTSGLDESLRNLQTDYLDLYLIHWPDSDTLFSEPMDSFASFKTEGKIVQGGVSNFDVGQMTECLKHFPIVTNQVGYHLFDNRPEEEVVDFCSENNMGVMAYGPMAHGLLTGTMTVDTKFEDDDWRRNLQAFGQPIFEGEHFLRNLEKVDRLRSFASDKGYTVAQLALAWVIANPVVSVALAGTRRASEIEQNVEVVD